MNVVFVVLKQETDLNLHRKQINTEKMRTCIDGLSEIRTHNPSVRQHAPPLDQAFKKIPVLDHYVRMYAP
jgi:hypothetical protein